MWAVALTAPVDLLGLIMKVVVLLTVSVVCMVSLRR